MKTMLSIFRSAYGRIFLASLSITMFLFFIDEGYYDFRWMKRVGNWIPFVIYLSLIFGLITGIWQLIRLTNRLITSLKGQ